VSIDWTALRLPRPRSALARGALVLADLAAVAFFLLSYSRHGVSFGPFHIDLDVYRHGSQVWLSGGNLYGRLPGVDLSFTYPPIAAVLLSPLSLVPMAVAGTVLTLGSVLLLVVVLRIFRPTVAEWPWAVAWLLPAALFLEPVRSTLLYGQVNIVLMALVSLDCMTSAPRWPRGALVGLAAAIKLTPVAFVLYLLLRRDYRAVVVAIVSCLAMTGLGFAVAWHDSVQYWTGTVFQIGRIGNVIYASNQSVQAVLARAGLDPTGPAGVAAWLTLSIVVLLAACRGMRQALRDSADAWALSLNAFAVLLVSPISWSHHWVWIGPALLALADIGYRARTRLPWLTAVSGLVVFAAAPQWWLPSGRDQELHWAAWQQLVGSSYVLFAAVVLALSATGRLRSEISVCRPIPIVDRVQVWPHP
jgi:alpha-1,2-mannosyltransferase